MKAMMTNSFLFSIACFRNTPSFSPTISLHFQNLDQTKWSSSKTMNSSKGPNSIIGVQHKFPKFSTEATLNQNMETKGVPSSVPVRVAHELLLAGHRYLDVRTTEEFNTGHISSAINVPYMYKIGSGMAKNTDFLGEVSSHFRKDDEIIVGCHLGKRSTMAAADLLAAGFNGVTDIAGGYVAWIQNGLPTEL